MRRLLPLFSLALLSCTGAVTATGFTPVTSVVLRADSVVPASQCGKAPNQIAKYTAVVSSIQHDSMGAAVSTPLAGQTYDCFADAMFANMVGTQFEIDVFAWSADAYAAAMLSSIEAQLRQTTQCSSDVDCTARGAGFESTTCNSVSRVCDPNPSKTALDALQKLNATSRRTCTATQINNVQAVARCDAAMVPEGGADGAADSGMGVDAGKDAGGD